MLWDRRIRWRSPEHQGLESVCRVRVSQGPLGLVVVIVDVPENNGPSIESVIAPLVLALTHSEVRELPGYENFDSAMWFMGIETQAGGLFLRIREGETACFELEKEPLSLDIVGGLLGMAPEDIFEGNRQ